jgi:hypothetical protein
MALKNKSLNQIADLSLPSRRTIKRWLIWLEAVFKVAEFRLLTYFTALSGHLEYKPFWSACFKRMSLAKAMFYVQKGGESVP